LICPLFSKVENPRTRSTEGACARLNPCLRRDDIGEKMSAKVAFIGLGVMGFPMAGHLKAKGYDVTVYNRTGAKGEQWVQKHGGKSAPTPAAAAKDADFVMTMVGNDKDVEEVILGKDGALAGMKKGAVLVDHTTASADVARKVYAAAKDKGVPFIDAPVSGGQAGAENG